MTASIDVVGARLARQRRWLASPEYKGTRAAREKAAQFSMFLVGGS